MGKHKWGSPAITVLGADRTFGDTTVEYVWKARRSLERAVEVIARTKERLTIADDPDRNGVIYYTSIPWVSFTGGTHPIRRPKDPFFDLGNKSHEPTVS